MPRIQLDTYGRRAFAVIGPTVWNAIGNDLRDPDLSIASFGRLLKTHLFSAVLGTSSALEALCDNTLYKLTLTLTIGLITEAQRKKIFGDDSGTIGTLLFTLGWDVRHTNVTVGGKSADGGT